MKAYIWLVGDRNIWHWFELVFSSKLLRSVATYRAETRDNLTRIGDRFLLICDGQRGRGGEGGCWQECYHTEDVLSLSGTKSRFRHSSSYRSLMRAYSWSSSVILKIEISFHTQTSSRHDKFSLVPEHSRLLLLRPSPVSLAPHAPHGVRPRHVRGVGRGPVLLQPGAQVLARLLEVVLVQDDVPHLQRALRQLLSRHHLHVHVLGLRLSPGFDKSLENFWRGYLINDCFWSNIINCFFNWACRPIPVDKRGLDSVKFLVTGLDGLWCHSQGRLTEGILIVQIFFRFHFELRLNLSLGSWSVLWVLSWRDCSEHSSWLAICQRIHG